MIIIDNNLYDVEEFNHPGGEIILSHLNTDASDVFHAFHSPEAFEVLSRFHVSVVNEKTTPIAQRFQQLRNEFIKLKLFEADFVFFLIHLFINFCLLIFSLVVGLMFKNIHGVLSSACIMALFWQQCGWLAHDFLHHSVFKNRRYNLYMAYVLGGLCQGFSPMWWKNKHNTHHAHPNLHGSDPDIDTLPFLAWSELDISILKTKFFIRYQAYFYFPLLAIARLSWCLQSITYVYSNKHEIWEPISLGLHWILMIFYLMQFPIKLSIVFLITSQFVCGILLALVFSLNHNGMAVLEKQTDFFTQQIITGRDIHPNWFTNWFCGGLNFQIEHHIFPLMPRHNYPFVQSYVESVCREFNVPHHCVSFWQGTLEVLCKLESISKTARKSE